MQLYIPNQDPFSNDFPAQPRKVKAWLKQLPVVNIGETTRQFYHGLMKANRKSMVGKHRLEVMEALRPTARYLLNNLRKQHLVARSLPLPPKTRKIMQLQQSLLAEMAIGYKHIVLEAATGYTKVDKKSIAVCIHRTMRYLGEQLRTSAQNYARDPQGIWNELTHLYLYAEQLNVLERTVKDADYYELEKSSLQDVFKQIILFALAKPRSLHQGEADKVDAFLEKISAACDVGNEAIADNAGNVYYLDTSLDKPPVYAVFNDVVSTASNRYFDLTKIIDDLTAKVQGKAPDQSEAITNRSVLSGNLANRLLRAYTTNAKRRFTRLDTQSKVFVAVGLNDIYQAISDDVQSTHLEQRDARILNELDLSLVPQNELNGARTDYLLAPEEKLSGSEDYWDMVARGTVVNDTLLNAKHEAPEITELPQPKTWHTWDMLDTSPGGYRLRWTQQGGSKAQVGEILALREKDGGHYIWRCGIIRWMQCCEPVGLEVGVQLLSPITLLATIEPDGSSCCDNVEPLEALMLPRVKKMNQPPTLLTPAGFFEEGHQVKFILFKHQLKVELSELRERSGTFNRFRYTVVTDQADNSTDETEQGFGSLWPTL
jgi:hypothetical protein